MNKSNITTDEKFVTYNLLYFSTIMLKGNS